MRLCIQATLCALAAALCALTLPSAACADSACLPDAWQYCGNVAPGAGRLRICLGSNWDNLSSTCREKVAEVVEKAQALQQNCGADLERLCPGLKPGGGQLYLCLKAQESKTSSQCRAALR